MINTKKLMLEAFHVGLYYNNKRTIDLRGKHRFWAIRDVSFSLYEGECLGIIGKNGAGKSSLLRIIAGIHQPNLGVLNAFGNSIALLTLGAGFINSLSGKDNMLLSAQLLGLKKKEATKRLESMVQFAELEDFIDEPVFTYSTGMKARLGFAVAIQSDPDVLLIDEVLGVGDKDFKKKSAMAMRELISSGKTVILISHNANTIEELASKAILLEKGCSIMEGEPKEVIAVYNQK